MIEMELLEFLVLYCIGFILGVIISVVILSWISNIDGAAWRMRMWRFKIWMKNKWNTVKKR